MNTFPKLAAAIVLVFGLTGLSNYAEAFHFEITDITNLSSGNFRSTVFHTASKYGGMGGTILAEADQGTVAVGSQYDSVTGDINFGFDLDGGVGVSGGNSVSATGNILFPGLGNNDVIGSITYTFANAINGSNVHTIKYLDFDYGVPNTFDNVVFMALWGSSGSPLVGANDPDTSKYGKFTTSNSFLGSDLRLVLSPLSVVPLPAALPLYGTGLAIMSFIGWRKKRKAAMA